MAENVKRLLAVSWAMPPLLTPRSVQVGRALKTFSQRGWQIDVIAVDTDDLPEGYYSIDWDLESFYGSYYQAIRVGHDADQPIKNDLLMLRWRKPALEAAVRLLNDNRYTAVLTFAQPWVDHLVGLELQRISGLPWIAHFSDPWVDNFYYGGVDWNLRQEWPTMEAEVIRRADKLIFTNPSAANLVMQKYYRGWRKKVAVIPHAYDSDPGELAPTLHQENSPLHLVYTGGLYGHRSPEGFYDALVVLDRKKPLVDRLDVLIAGPVDPHFKQMTIDLGLGSIVRFEDLVPYRRSLELLRNADVLLLIDATVSSSPFLPSKLVDYLTFQRPILGITPQEGVSADLLRRLDCPVAAPDDPGQIAVALEQLLIEWECGFLPGKMEYKSVLVEYSLDQIGSQFDGVLHQAIHRNLTGRWWDRLLSPTVAGLLHRLTVAPIIPRLVRRLKAMLHSNINGV
jgi:hypothetical protein